MSSSSVDTISDEGVNCDQVTQKEAVSNEVMTTRKPEEKAENVSISIAKKFDHLSHPTSECCIFRMYDHLAKENKKAYEPSIVAIGPYHRGKANLQQMEMHKLWYLQQLLNREEEKSADKYVMAIRELEGRARNCYAESISLESDEFVEMLLLDGVFIIELFCKPMDGEYIHEDDHIFQTSQIVDALQHDLILLENQVPFFILDHLFSVTNTSSNFGIIEIALNFLESPERKLEARSGIQINNIKHLLDLVHDCCCFKFAETPRKSVELWDFIKSATELQEAGVQFNVARNSSNLVDIKFNSGALEIPLLSITTSTESFFTNLVAFEICPNKDFSLLEDSPKKDFNLYVCDYIVFMDCLINSSENVHVLRRSGIIKSWIGNDEEVYTMWHKLFKITVTNLRNFSYSEVFNEVNNHCNLRRNVWIANLRRNYFNSPWALISFFAAVILLLLTVAQTIFSILSFGRGGI